MSEPVNYLLFIKQRRNDHINNDYLDDCLAILNMVTIIIRFINLLNVIVTI